MLEFVDVAYTVKAPKKGVKVLIRDCSARIYPGHVLALMGPSGAGKTTLLNALTLEPSGGTPYGRITLNGHPFTLSVYRKYAASVAQSDTLWAFLTTKEHLSLAVGLMQPALSKVEKAAVVDDVLMNTGMEGVASVKAGNQFFKGLSGGQKRRLSLGIALCKKPLVVFLDEPTSGLDAAAAASITTFLTATAARSNVAIICTIHQPSSSVFAGFDSVCFLTAGQIAYLGEAANVGSYCESIGHKIPAYTNPADFMLDLINKDFSDPDTVDKIVGEWNKRREAITNMAPVDLGERQPRSKCNDFRVLLRKQLILTRRDPLAYAMRMVSVFFMTIFFAIIYIEQREPEQDQVFNRFCFLFWLLLVPASLGVTVVFALSLETQIIKREAKDGMYSTLVLALVKTVIESPMMLLMTLLGLVPAAYPIANFEYSTMFEMIVTCTIQLWSMECLAQLNSLSSNPMLGMLNFLQAFNFFMLFCGLPLQPSQVTWVFRWIAYVSPLRWGLSTMTYYAFINMEMVGSEDCPDADFLNSTICHGRPFFCNTTASDSLECYGRNGRDVLSTLGERFELLTPDYDWQLSLVLLAITTMALKVFYVLGFYYVTHQYALPLPPDNVPPLEIKRKEERKHEGEARKGSSFGRLGATLDFTDISYTVKTKKGVKTLLRDCSASVPAGEVLALMGPSGAGKTTLLNVLTLTPSGGTAYGTITLNGNPFTLSVYKKYGASVAQQDTLWAYLTVKEHLLYTVKLMQPLMEGDKRAGLVEDVLNATGMEGVKDVKAGNQFFKGLSGGQKRRLSLGVALCKKPHVVFLDEPTSGLDAAAAASIMKLLKATALVTSVGIICTIHQPSSAVFERFDKVCFLTGGRMAYLGKASAVTAYFEKVGRPMPPNTNPADYMLDLINKDFSDPATVDHVVEEWEKHRPEVRNMAPDTLANIPQTTVCGQLSVLFRKHCLLAVRDPLVYIARIVVIVVTNTFIAILYIEGRQKRQARALSLFFYLFFAVAIPGMLSLTTVLLSNLELQIVKREVKDNAYSAGAYALVGLTIHVPLMFVLAFAVIFPSFYPMMDLAWDGFGANLFIMAVGLWALDACAQLQSVIDNPLMGMMNQMNIWFFSFCYAGIWLPVDDIIWPFRAFCYILPYRWQLPAVAYNMLAYSPRYEGAHRCDPTTSLAIEGPYNGTILDCNSRTLDPDGYGFYCGADVNVASCYGQTGRQILDSFGTVFRTIQSTDPDIGDFWFLYAMLLVAMALVCKVGHVIAVWKVCNRTAPCIPVEPTSRSATK
ncbi:MAG: hypothetical protein SGPRY_005037 [Prymnesium sp.]